MGRVLIKCPKTGKDVFTGFDMPKAAFDGSTFKNNKTHCPHCGETHAWNKADARVEGE